jgi:hypothetical protein
MSEDNEQKGGGMKISYLVAQQVYALVRETAHVYTPKGTSGWKTEAGILDAVVSFLEERRILARAACGDLDQKEAAEAYHRAKQTLSDDV